MRVLFMGTPDFALFTLKALVAAGEEIVGVVTQPDKPKGRGYELQPPPVKVYATEQGIPVYQPATLKNGAFDAELAALAPDVIVVVAYGKILPPLGAALPPLRVCKRARVAFAALPRRRTHAACHYGGQCRNGRDHHADERGA